MRKIDMRTVVWMVVVVIVVVGLAWYAAIMRQGGGSGGSPQAAPAVYAPQGQVIQGFPKQLILDNAAVVNNSYSITYSAGADQYTAQWNSSSSVTALYNAYKQYLPANGWTITNDVATPSWFRGLYATDASGDASIAISAQGKESQVVITYLIK